MHSIFVKWHRQTYPLNRNASSLLENQYETSEKHGCGNVSPSNLMPQCTKWLFPTAAMCLKTASSNRNDWIHKLPRDNLSTMVLALVERNFSRFDILLTFMWCQFNVMALVNNFSGTGARWQWKIPFIMWDLSINEIRKDLVEWEWGEWKIGAIFVLVTFSVIAKDSVVTWAVKHRLNKDL